MGQGGETTELQSIKYPVKKSISFYLLFSERNKKPITERFAMYHEQGGPLQHRFSAPNFP